MSPGKSAQSALHPRHRAVIDALLPSRACEELPWGAFDAGFEDFHARFSREAPFALRLGFALACWAGAWAAPALIGRLPPITRLSPDERERALEALARCRVYPLRQSVLVLKAVTSFCYGADPRVRRALRPERRP